MCLIEFCPLNFLRLIWTLWSICGAWKLHSNTNLLKFFKNRCERLNQSGPRVSDFKTFNHPKAKNSSAPWICCNLLIIISSVTLIIFNWKWKRPVLGMRGTDGLNRIDMDIARQLKHEIPDNSLLMINLISICKSINLNSETFCRSLISANKIIISH